MIQPASHRGVAGDLRVALACALIAVLAALAACFAAQNGTFDPSALVKLSRDEPLAAVARSVDPGFTFVNPVEHYDGVYYYAMALDPLLRGQEHTLIDQAGYRYGHPMYGWLARTVVLGQDGAVPWGLLGVTVLSAAVAGFVVSRLAVAYGRTPWGGLLVAVSPGLLYAATVSTTEWLGVALMALVLLLWQRGALLGAGLVLVLLCLTKEQFVTVPLGLAVWTLVQCKRHGGPGRLPARAAALVAGPAALTLWYLYVHAQLGAFPANYQPGNFGAPGTGWLEAFRQSEALSRGSFDQSQIGAITPPVLVAVAVLVLLASVAAVRIRTPLDAILLGMAAITASMGWLTLTYPHELIRTPSTVVLVAIAVLLIRPAPAPEKGSATDGSHDVDVGVADLGALDPEPGVRPALDSLPGRPARGVGQQHHGADAGALEQDH